ncbi:hypothetical protein, partial [Geobacter anodireducens]
LFALTHQVNLPISIYRTVSGGSGKIKGSTAVYRLNAVDSWPPLWGESSSDCIFRHTAMMHQPPPEQIVIGPGEAVALNQVSCIAGDFAAWKILDATSAYGPVKLGLPWSSGAGAGNHPDRTYGQDKNRMRGLDYGREGVVGQLFQLLVIGFGKEIAFLESPALV